MIIEKPSFANKIFIIFDGTLEALTAISAFVLTLWILTPFDITKYGEWAIIVSLLFAFSFGLYRLYKNNTKDI